MIFQQTMRAPYIYIYIFIYLFTVPQILYDHRYINDMYIYKTNRGSERKPKRKGETKPPNPASTNKQARTLVFRT